MRLQFCIGLPVISPSITTIGDIRLNQMHNASTMNAKKDPHGQPSRRHVQAGLCCEHLEKWRSSRRNFHHKPPPVAEFAVGKPGLPSRSAPSPLPLERNKTRLFKDERHAIESGPSQARSIIF